MCVAMSPCLMLVALAAGALAALAPATLPRLSTDKYNMKQSNKSLEFVREIREDLRRNNDDYVAAELRERQQRLSRSKGKFPKRAPPQRMDTRRALNATAASAANRTAVAAGAPVARTNETHFRSNVQTLEYFKNLRIDKLKRLIDKGKSRLRNLMTPGASSPGGGVPHEDDHHPHENDHHAHEQDHHDLVLAGAPAVSSEHENENRVPMRHHRGERHSPSPDQLDMAPARGVHVHMMRLQGRLCHRHLLNPEGPLYDHHGTSIMPAYLPENAHGRLFEETHPPNVILPRCCNCCKKSVLGCQ